MKNRSPIFTIIAAAFSCLYIALRLWGFTDSCMWFDEIFGVHAAEMPIGELMWFVAQDLIHPPLFYLLLKGWIAAGGESLWWLRMFSVFFSALALVPFLLLCKELKLTQTTRLIALAFFAANGALIKYAQELRMYGPLLFLSLASMWLFARYFYRGKNIWILTIVNILLVYTHYFGWLVVASEVVAILLMQRMKVRQVLVLLAVLAAAYVPWVWALARAAGVGADVRQNIGWIEKPGLRSLLDFGFDVLEPFYYPQSSIDPSTVLLVTLPLLAVVAVATAISFIDREKGDDRSAFWLLLILAAVPVASALVISWMFPVSVWGTRHLIVAFSPMMIMIGVAFDAVEPARLRFGLIALISVLFVAAFVLRLNATARAEMIWCTWEKQAASIPAGQPQTVYVFEDLVAYHMWFAVRNEPNFHIVKVNGVPDMNEDAAYFLPRGFTGVQVVSPGDIAGERFWVAFRDMQWNEKHPPLNLLTAAGYKISPPQIIDAGGLKSFLAEVKR